MFEKIWEFLPYIVKGASVTLSLVFGAMAISALMGLSIALGAVYGGKKILAPLRVYIWFFRGMPPVVLIFLFFYGIFPSLGHRLDAFTASILVLGFRDAAYQSEIFRGAIESITGEQMLAARSLGMSKLRAIYSIILPQALRISLPGWSNEYAILLKDSAICFVIGVLEILTRTRYVAMTTLEPLMPYAFAAMLFIVLTYGGTGIFNWVYEKTKIPGLIRKV